MMLVIWQEAEVVVEEEKVQSWTRRGKRRGAQWAEPGETW